MGNTTQKLNSQHFDYNVPTQEQKSTVRAQLINDMINPEGIRDRAARDQISKARITTTDIAIDQRNRPVQHMFFDPDNRKRIIDVAVSMNIFKETEVIKSMNAIYGRTEHEINNIDVTNRSSIINMVQRLNAETIENLKTQKSIFVPEQPKIQSHLSSIYHLPDTTDNNKEFRRDNR